MGDSDTKGPWSIVHSPWPITIKIDVSDIKLILLERRF